MILGLDKANITAQNGHSYTKYRLNGNTVWVNEVANEYINLRSECILPLSEVSLDGIEVLSVEGLRARIEKATLPVRGSGNFDIVRSDFGETVGYMLLEQDYGTKFGYKGVRDRETIQLPGRGIDGVGIEDDGQVIRLILSEVKVSDEDNSPPQVVDRSSDCLRAQHLSHLGDTKVTAKKIWNLVRHIKDQQVQNLHVVAALRLEAGDWEELSIIVSCILVRPDSKYTDADFGSFRRSPGDFLPAKVRFLVFCIPENVDQFINNWYTLVLERIGRNDGSNP